MSKTNSYKSMRNLVNLYDLQIRELELNARHLRIHVEDLELAVSILEKRNEALERALALAKPYIPEDALIE